MAVEINRALIVEFVKRQLFAVVSTTDGGRVQAATVAFTECNEFDIIFSTLRSTRKYRNLKADPRAAFVIGWDEFVTVQMEGLAEELDGDRLRECQALHIAKHPTSEKYANLDGNTYFLFTPTWLRYTDISKEPEFTFELDWCSSKANS